MKITHISCKTALSPSKLPGIDYSLNPYRGCEHSCAYCYAPNVLKINREKWGDFVDVKVNIPLILSKELKLKVFGFDLIKPNNQNKLYLVDLNDFPGFRGIDNIENIFVKFIKNILTTIEK